MFFLFGKDDIGFVLIFVDESYFDFVLGGGFGFGIGLGVIGFYYMVLVVFRILFNQIYSIVVLFLSRVPHFLDY